MAATFEPDRLSPHAQAGFWAMLAHLQHHGPALAAELAAVMNAHGVGDKFARTILAWATRDEWLVREPEGQTFRYDLAPDLR